MKPGLFVSLALVLLVCSGLVRDRMWLIHRDSEIVIQGATNVNRFVCRIACYEGTDTLRYQTDDKACQIRFDRNAMSIPIRSFDCGSKTISNDFRDALQSDRYPLLDIRLLSLQTNALRDSDRVKSVVDITLAGKTKRFNTEYAVDIDKGNIIRLNGVQTVHFADFGLTPPEKFSGLVKVKEALEVRFNLVIREL